MRRERSGRRRAVWGVLLIALGLWFLLRQMGMTDWFDWRPMWPAILIVIGVASMAAAERPRQFASGLSFVFWGLWFFACIQHWYGLTYRTAWPLLLVVAGFEIVLAAVLERLLPPKKKEEEHHA